ncbi:DUF1707 SHOCT-like domain-containing protein [Kribbella kalugense]|uniref:DUF1707 SHOCT-like domain-containing protein n=1 Tax=Kribbella kalugense TaxID=2512221 RepID=UPI0014170B8E|nr:DUF1707 domain-containing protein [Kribbella kalugense]
MLRYLEGRALSRAELVRFTGTTDLQVQAVLDELIGTAHVVRRPQDIGPADYELTPAGVERLAQVGRLTASPAPATKRPATAKRPPVVKRRPPLRRPTAAVLTEHEWELCSEALTQYYALGRIDKADLARRTHLLYVARTRDDLDAIFVGQPMPDLPKPVRSAPAPPTPILTSQASSAAPARTAKFAAEPEPLDRQLIVNLAKSLAVGLLFTGIVIATGPSLVILLAILVVTGGNMFRTYRTWAKKRRSG